MNSFKKLLVCLIIFAASNQLAHATNDREPGVNFAVGMMALENLDLKNTKTLGNYIDLKKKLGAFSENDVAEFKSFFKSQKYSLKSKNSTATWSGKRFTVGSAWIEVLDWKRVKLSNGRIVKLSNSLSPYVRFSKIFSAFTEKQKTAGSFVTIIPRAEAWVFGEIGDFIDSALMIAAFAPKYVIKDLPDMLWCSGQVPFDFVRKVLEYSLRKNAISCGENGDYILNRKSLDLSLIGKEFLRGLNNRSWTTTEDAKTAEGRVGKRLGYISAYLHVCNLISERLLDRFNSRLSPKSEELRDGFGHGKDDKKILRRSKIPMAPSFIKKSGAPGKCRTGSDIFALRTYINSLHSQSIKDSSKLRQSNLRSNKKEGKAKGTN